MNYVGFSLDVPESKILEIQSNYHDKAQRRDAYIDAYVNDHPCPQWRDVSHALRLVHLDHQADVVERTYVEGTIKV